MTNSSPCGSQALRPVRRVIVQGQDFVREGQIVEAVTGDLQNAKR